jgi:hypothetical protein
MKCKRLHLLHANGAHIVFHIVINTRDSWQVERGFMADCSCSRGRQNKKDTWRLFGVDLLADICPKRLGASEIVLAFGGKVD